MVPEGAAISIRAMFAPLRHSETSDSHIWFRKGTGLSRVLSDPEKKFGKGNLAKIADVSIYSNSEILVIFSTLILIFLWQV